VNTTTILGRWAACVARCGQAEAIDSGDRRLTYTELADRVAGYEAVLTRADSGTGPVLLLAADAVRVIAAMLGCMAAGRTFAPADPRLPPAGIADLIAVLAPETVIVDEAGQAALGGVALPDGVRVLGPRDVPDAPWEIERWLGSTAPDRGYVYFTSGSTGPPKGLRGSLAAIAHFVGWEIDEFSVGGDSRVSLLTSPGFDAFLRDAFVPLCAGGTVCVAPTGAGVGSALAHWLTESGVTLLHCVPTVFRTLRDEPVRPGSWPALRSVLLAGERVHASDVAWWRSRFGDGKDLVNLYGPSETTMTKLFRRLGEPDATGEVVPAGVALPGVRVRVLGPRPGAVGEIELEVPFRLLGYLGPEQGGFDAGGHRYRTGDLGRLREDGEVEVLGRRDQQVKVRGVRVELGQVEAVLRRHPGVRDACVLAVTGRSGTELCAYVLAPGIEDAELARHAGELLPPWLVPADFVAVGEIPRTLSGKVDRRGLPSPAAARRTGGEPPSGPLECEIAELAAAQLGVRGLGRRDDFTLLGGTSLTIARLLDQVRARFRAEVPLRALLADPTVAGLAEAVGAGLARMERAG
jgi:amino acid adenylation domain-containing protein